MISLTVASLAFYVFSILTYTVQYVHGLPLCMQDPKYHTVNRIMTSIDTVITLIIPTIAIASMNTAIGIRVYNYTKRTLKHDVNNACMSDYYNSSSIGSENPSHSREWAVNIRLNEHSNAVAICKTYRDRPQSVTGAAESGTQGRSVNNRQWRVYTRRHVSQMRVTRALLIISSVYLFLNLPSFAFRIHAFLMSLANTKLKISNYQWQGIIQFIYYLSFSAKFFLYIACSRNFRVALRRLFRRTAYNIHEMNISQYFKIRCWMRKPHNQRY